MFLILNKLKKRVKPNLLKLSVRYLNLLEHQNKEILRKYGVPIQDFVIIDKRTDISRHDFDNDFNAQRYVVKAQILAGGRQNGTFANGFVGGVHLTRDKQTLKDIVQNMLGNKLITLQTPKEGIMVNQVMIAESVDILRETYFCLMMDPYQRGPVAIVSPRGGVDIEDIAARTPTNIGVRVIDINEGINDDLAEELALFMQFSHNLTYALRAEILRLWQIFIELDALQLEINPFCETIDEKIIAVDIKMCFDDNAKFRQKEIFSMEHCFMPDYREVMASHYNLNFIGMDGNIGCLVNGAGLAMATMDLISLHNGKPANFLDVSGTVSELTIKVCFDIFKYDTTIRVILVNIFGGIVDCVTIAKGILTAYEVKKWNIPLVVRLKGTNAKEAIKILRNSDLCICFVDGFDEAAQKSVEYAKGIFKPGVIMESEKAPTLAGL